MRELISATVRRAVPWQWRTDGGGAQEPTAFSDADPAVPFIGRAPVRRRRLAALARELILVSALLCATVVMQVGDGGLQGERASHSDEAGHFMNGLVLRDYLKDGLGQNPITFAEQYYVSYPKIAVGMWPPLFHTVLGLFMLGTWPPQVAALVLLALLSTWAAWRLYRIVAIFDTKLVGALIAAMFVVASANMGLTTATMLDPRHRTTAITAPSEARVQRQRADLDDSVRIPPQDNEPRGPHRKAGREAAARDEPPRRRHVLVGARPGAVLADRLDELLA